MKFGKMKSPLLVCWFLFLAGIIVGALGLRVLSVDEKAELVSYLEVFMRSLSSYGVESSTIFRLSFMHNLKTGLLLWGFGLAVIGVPLTCMMLVVRGFALGFTSAFIVKEVAAGGLLVFAGGILPHNLISVPAFIILSSYSLSFSLMLVKERPWTYGGLWKSSLSYTLKFIIIMGVLVLSSLTEAYLSPNILSRMSL